MAEGTMPITIAPVATRPRVRRGAVRRALGNRSFAGFLMALPLILAIGGLVVYPAFYAIALSLMNKSMTQFVGFHNFDRLLKLQTFHLVIFQSCLFAITAVIAKAVLGFALAHLMHNIPTRKQRVFRGFFLVPWVIPLAISTLGWWWLFDPSYSAFNWALNKVGLPSIPWLGQPWWARFCMIWVNTWFGTPFFLIMYLAALKSVPEQLYEAAAIDGAGAFQKLVHVTLPMLRNVISITVLFSLIVTFANFDIVRILTNGGPLNTTHVFATYAFQIGIQSGNIPAGAAVSLFMFPILAIASFFVLRGITQRSKEAY